MAAFVKGKLKLARESIGKKDFEAARHAAAQVLEYEPENYNANVFLGLALLELGKLEQSEQVYRKAIDSSPEQPLAWQGLSKFYERTKNWVKYGEALERLAKIFAEAHDASKCAEVVQKLIDLQRERGSKEEIVRVLSFLLPTSKFYSVLSDLPAPDPTNPTATTTFGVQAAIHDSLPTLEELAAIVEVEEDEVIKKEIDKRRMRLGAPRAEELKKVVGREIWAESQLPNLYNEIISHPNTSDELRRLTEAKLLRHKQRYLHALPASDDFASQKTKIAGEVQELVNGAVLLGIPDELAWMIFIDGKDVDSIDGYDLSVLRRFMRLFPSTPLSKVIQGYFIYDSVPLLEGDDEEDDDTPAWPEEDDPLDIVLDALSSLQDCIFAHRILAVLYSRELDHQNSIKVAEAGLTLVKKAEADNGKRMSRVKKAFNVVLAIGLVHLYPPKHHLRALDLLDTVLREDPDNVQCLMGRAYVLQYQEKWEEADALFTRVGAILPEDLTYGLEAEEEKAWCQMHMGHLDTGAQMFRTILDVLDELDERDVQKARCWWRLGRCYWEMGVETREDAYRHFITSLKRSQTFAPAFTSLGIYYSEFVQPPDPTRASKCFQKAFELDAREADAARRLAVGFAEDSEWDLVEVVARRTIDGEGGMHAGTEGTHAAAVRYLPTNAWAWKAVGVVELNHRRYPAAIQSFQIALRADTDDHLSWVRLGEAYMKAGRHAAAIKALDRAKELQPDDWMCLYLIGEVYRQTGQFQEAVKSLEEILATRPTEPGVMLSLAQSHLDLGRSEFSDGYSARAESSFLSSITVALQMIDSSSGFRRVIWKTASDAAFHLSKCSKFHDAEAVHLVLELLSTLITVDSGERLSGILALPLRVGDAPIDSSFALKVAVAAYNYRTSFGWHDDDSAGGGWYDLGAALYSLSARTLSTETRELTQTRALSCMKDAVRANPANSSYWTALGNLNFNEHPKMAQHAYIKALEIDSKNVEPWTCLGLLYLQHNDIELANEALYRAQTLDPDYTLAWVGQGLVASANGHDKDAMALFEHAVGLSADVPDADLQFAIRAFSKLSSPSNRHPPSPELFIPSFFVLDRYCRRRPDDASALHLFGLVCERLRHIELAVDLVTRAIAILETVYEETEDPIIESQFTMANSTLGRLRLANQDYEGALESFQSALGLLPENSASSNAYDVDAESPTSILRAHALFGSGLANFKLGELESALAMFESALEAGGANSLIRGHVTVLLAQTLWAMGSEECRETAKAQLLESISADPENLAAITALAAMGNLTDDDGLVDAALSEILELPLERRHNLDPARDVDYLLVRHHFAQGDFKQALAIAQSAVFAEPSRREARRTVVEIMLQQQGGQNGSTNAHAVLAGVSRHLEGDSGDLYQDLLLSAISGVLPRDQEGWARKEVQKAVIFAPWERRNWTALAYVQSMRVS